MFFLKLEKIKFSLLGQPDKFIIIIIIIIKLFFFILRIKH